MKKSKKKNNRRSYPSYYTPGRNMFGEKAETYLIVLKRETALQQMLDAIRQLDGENGKMEFTFDMRCFNEHPEELAEVQAKVQAFLAFKASLQNMSFHSYDLSKAS